MVARRGEIFNVFGEVRVIVIRGIRVCSDVSSDCGSYFFGNIGNFFFTRGYLKL